MGTKSAIGSTGLAVRFMSDSTGGRRGTPTHWPKIEAAQTTEIDAMHKLIGS